jgi:glycosyltransferase involved in cell wall biosynthesis
MSLRVLLVTDAFPPVSGGSGWSTYELARGLRARGDTVTIVRPRPGEPPGGRLVTGAWDGFDVHEIGAWAPPLPFIRNYFKNERLARTLVPHLRAIIRDTRADLVHGQHLLSTPAAIAAARAEHVPAVATVRDYWPVCYWSDLIHDYAAPTLCPGCSAAMMTRCVRPRGGALWPTALPFIPYMRANLRWKQRTLAHADAIVAVSSTIGDDLRARAPDIAAHPRLSVIPNPLGIDAVRAAVAAAPTPDAASPYAIYVGKLAPNKGVSHLIPAVQRARLTWPLVIVGDGPDRAAMEQAAAAADVDARFTGWLDRDEGLRRLAGASLLIFPSHGPESLSRVLLEASALGVPIAAMNTGGTRDIIVDEETGLLSATAHELSDDIARLAGDAALRQRLGAAARAHVERHFAAPSVVARIADLYEQLVRERAAGASRG